MTKFYHLNLLDDSGSMCSVRQETIDGYNKQIDAMQQCMKDHPEQEHFACLVIFNSSVRYDTWIKPADQAKKLDFTTYAPDGGTAMLDAIGMGVNGLRNEIADALKDPETKVFVTIFTDGEENGSKEFNGADCFALRDEVEKTGQWTFAFMGCSENTLEQAKNLGISASNTMQYRSGGVGTQAAFDTLSATRTKLSASYAAGTYAETARNLFDTTDTTGD